jgi:recombination protein RecA
MTTKTDDSKYSETHGSSLSLNAGDKKARESLLAKILKEHGDGSVQIGKAAPIEAISTGSLALDIATGIGGYPRGRITQISGWESSGKTTHALKAAANVQERGGTVAFIDTEYALDPHWAEKLGVNLGTFEWIKVDSLEIAGEVAVDLAESSVYDMVILDSIAGSPIKAVVAGELGDANMGKRAKIMSDFMPKLNGPVSRNHLWMIITNQLRDSLNMYSPKPVRPGGHALNFHSSMTVDLKSKRKDDQLIVKAIVEKNKLAPPGKQVEYLMDVNGYIDMVDELAGILTDSSLQETFGIIRAGAWYTLPQELFPDYPEAKFNGKAKIMEALADLDAFERVVHYVKSKVM